MSASRLMSMLSCSSVYLDLLRRTSSRSFLGSLLHIRTNNLLDSQNSYLSCKRSYSSGSLPAEAESRNDTEIRYDTEVHYPPIKPKYPPGRWKDLSEQSAWYIHNMAHDILAIPRAKERLENLAGEKSNVLWLVEAMDTRPKNLTFKKLITKTHIASGFPEIISSINVDEVYGRVKSVFPDLIAQEAEYICQKKELNDTEVDQNKYHTHKLLGSITRHLISQFSSSNEHLLRSELDEDVRVESFWRVGGFSGKEKVASGKWRIPKTQDGKNAGILQFQYRHKADWQIRSELPLPALVPMDSALCNEQVAVRPDYAPSAVGMTTIQDRPTNVSGHWIGSPCEFCIGSIHVMPTDPVKKLLEVGKSYTDEAEVVFGLMTAFGSCVAQAHNQGFCDLLDVTYPLTTQCVISNGKYLRFVAYQLNTLQLWNDANPTCNIVWLTEAMPMYESIENGQVKGFNDDTFKMFTKFLSFKPINRGINLRPYLPEEDSPANKDLYINFKGQEPLVKPPIGRWQYPRNSVYF